LTIGRGRRRDVLIALGTVCLLAPFATASRPVLVHPDRRFGIIGQRWSGASANPRCRRRRAVGPIRGSVNAEGAASRERPPMRAFAVKSPERSECVRHTFTPCCRRQPSPLTDRHPFSRSLTNARPTSSQLAAAGKSGLDRATTTSYACQSGETDHPITYALRRASCSPEASEPHLSSGVSG
jgi:hypothetical protein